MHAWRECKKYLEMLAVMGGLSNLFASGSVPFIHYRVTENLFCKYCNAISLARGDTAYDAQMGDVGIGIKTCMLKSGSSIEKIAEFNKLSPTLRPLEGIPLAVQLAEFRNKRIHDANERYGINEAYYHIIGRTDGYLVLFDTSYEPIKTDSIRIIKETDRALHFTDGENFYDFNRSKSVLQRRFIANRDSLVIPVEIVSDPYELLEKLITVEPAVAEVVRPKSPENPPLPESSENNNENMPS